MSNLVQSRGSSWNRTCKSHYLVSELPAEQLYTMLLNWTHALSVHRLTFTAPADRAVQETPV